VPAEDTPRIAAFVTGGPASLSERLLRQALLQRLPATMLPDSIQCLPQLPTAAGGKVDRQALARLIPEVSAVNMT